MSKLTVLPTTSDPSPGHRLLPIKLQPGFWGGPKEKRRNNAIWIKGSKIMSRSVALANIGLNWAFRGKVLQHPQAKSPKYHIAQEDNVHTRQ